VTKLIRPKHGRGIKSIQASQLHSLRSATDDNYSPILMNKPTIGSWLSSASIVGMGQLEPDDGDKTSGDDASGAQTRPRGNRNVYQA
jgi:hypothetical protein